MKPSPEILALRWKDTCAHYSPHEWVAARNVVTANKAALADYFYECMLADPNAAFFLSDQLVKTKLHASMQDWLESVYAAAPTEEYERTVAFQRKVGEVHARIDIPVHLVMRGACALIRRICELLDRDASLSAAQAAATCRYVADVTMTAVEMMCHAYSVSHDRNARAEEGYRLLALSQNVGAERERQRAALLDWENQLMFGLSVGKPWDELPPIRESEFGLWFIHKAAHAFEGAAESRSVSSQLQHIDQLLADAQQTQPPPDQRLAILHSVRDATKAIGFLIDGLFEQAGNLESGRDTLTRLLNRKYLHVVLSKEVAYARKTGVPLSVLVADIDYFKSINDAHGHDAGDFVLQQVASLIASYSRGGDYTFRLGGEEFLVVLVDADGTQALNVAEALRRRIQEKATVLPDGGEVRLTLSIGVAAHDRHPDYQRLLKRADQALYAAKSGGRNRCVLANAGPAEPSQRPDAVAQSGQH